MMASLNQMYIAVADDDNCIAGPCEPGWPIFNMITFSCTRGWLNNEQPYVATDDDANCRVGSIVGPQVLPLSPIPLSGHISGYWDCRPLKLKEATMSTKKVHQDKGRRKSALSDLHQLSNIHVFHISLGTVSHKKECVLSDIAQISFWVKIYSF